MKKIGALLLVMFFCGHLTLASAADIMYTLGEGMEVCLQEDADKLLPPDGLEAMYHWMKMDQAEGDTVYFVRMPAGRVLVCCCLTEVGAPLSAQELCDLWPALAEGLKTGVLFLNEDPNCATVTEFAEREWMHVQTRFALDGETMLSVDLEGYAACQDGTVAEIWLASPSLSAYLYDNNASAELTADLQAAQEWLQSVRYGE